MYLKRVFRWAARQVAALVRSGQTASVMVAQVFVKSKGSNSKYEFMDNTNVSTSFYYQMKTNNLDEKRVFQKLF